MSIWSDVILDQLTLDAQQSINLDVQSLFHRFYFATVAGTSTYTLPAKVKGIRSITWRGLKLFPVSWLDIETGYPGSPFINPIQSRPQFYALHPTNVKDIRFYPAPDETFVTTGDPYAPTTNEARCLISCWRHVDSSAAASTLPTYIERRTVKAYVLWRAFEKEGKGQNLNAAAFYKKKYEFLIAQFRRINEGAYISKRYGLNDNQLGMGRMPRPMLSANYERTIY